MVNNNNKNKNNSSNSLVFGPWPQTKISSYSGAYKQSPSSQYFTVYIYLDLND